MTRQISVIQITSAEDAVQKIEEIAQLFEKYGVLVIKGHKFLLNEQFKITQLLGDKYGWNINSASDKELMLNAHHVGGQSIDIERDYSVKKDEYMLDYHIEQTFFVYPPLAGMWCMEKIICPPGHGNTKFVDSNEVYNLLSKEEQNFLKDSIFVWDKPAGGEVGPFYNKAIDFHPTSGLPIIRIETDGGCYITPTLYSLAGKAPTKKQSNKFAEIFSKIKNKLYDNKEIEYEHQWEDGDFLIVDLFRMYHAVMGGFKYQERIMSMIVVSNCPEVNSSYNIKPEIQKL